MVDDSPEVTMDGGERSGLIEVMEYEAGTKMALRS